MNPIRSVCVYCGSSPGRSPVYVETGLALGRSLGAHGLRLVYGGGERGVMGAVAEGARQSGAKVTGIIPRFLIEKEAAARSLDRLDEAVVVEDMHQRKQMMFERSDAFVALPGGIGTLEEIVEIMTWAQLGHHRKPIVFGNILGFWDPMLAAIEHMNGEGFIHTSHLVKPLVVDTPEAIVPAILIAASSVTAPTEGVRSVIEKL